MPSYAQSLVVGAMVWGGAQTVAFAQTDCDCDCPPGSIPTPATVEFSVDYTSHCADDSLSLHFDGDASTDTGCAKACSHGLGTMIDYESEECPPALAISETSGTVDGGFAATLHNPGLSTEYWLLTFSSDILGIPGKIGAYVYSTGTVYLWTSSGGVSSDYILGKVLCQENGDVYVDAHFDDSEDDDNGGDLVWTINFHLTGEQGACVPIPQFGYRGDCRYQEAEEDPNGGGGDPIDPGDGGEPGGGEPGDSGIFPEEGGGGGGGGCNEDEDESSSPVSYLTGHKVERETDLSISLPGRDFQLIREYTSDPNFYRPNSSGDYFWNSSFTDVIPGTAGVQWTLNVFQYITGDDGSGNSTLYVRGGDRMRSSHRYTQLGSQAVFVSTGAGNSYIEPDIYDSIPWLDSAGSTEDGEDVAVWRVRAPGGGEKVFMRVDSMAAPISGELDRTDLYGLLLYEIDAHGNRFEYRWTTLGDTGTLAGRENVRIDEIVSTGADDVDHAQIVFDWHPSGDGDWVYGRIEEVRVYRPASGSGWSSSPTQRVRYIYYDDIKNIEAQSVFGTVASTVDELRDYYDAEEGDLCEVVISRQVDEGGVEGMYDEVTQYRYYAENNNYGSDIADDSAVGGLAGFSPAGKAHQLMAVIYPQQVEYYAARVFNEFNALASSSEIQAALGIVSDEVDDFQNDVYDSSSAFISSVDAATRLRWVNFQGGQNGTNAFEFSQAALLPNSEWASLFDLAGKFITYYTELDGSYKASDGLHGEAYRVRTQLISSSSNGCGCSGAGTPYGLSKRYDYLYRRYELNQGFEPPASVTPSSGVDFPHTIRSDGYSCLVVESYMSVGTSGLEYVPYRVRCQDYYWPTSLPNGQVAPTESVPGTVSPFGVRRLAHAMCTADASWGSTDSFNPYEDPIDHEGKVWATTNIYGYDSTDPGATQFNSFGKLTATLTMEAVAASSTGYEAVADAGEDTVAPIIPQSSDAGKVLTYDYTDGYLTKRSVEEGTGHTTYDVLQEMDRGASGDRPDVVTETTRDAGDGVVETRSIAYGYYDNTGSTDPNGAIVAWMKSEMSPETPAQNGPASPSSIDYSNWSFYDHLGQLRWERDADGTLTYYQYDEHTGKMTRMTQDADPGDTTIPSGIAINETNFPGITSAGWSLPTRSSYDELTSSYVYDALGRQIESTDAAGVTRYMRRVVLDASHASLDSNYAKLIVPSVGPQYWLLYDYGVGLYATLDFPHKLTDGSFDGPLSVSWQDAAGTSLRESSFECLSSGGSYDPSAGTYAIGEEYSRSDSELAVTGSTVRSRQWFDTQAINVDAGSFFTETRYDALGRAYQIIDPLGSVMQYGTSTLPGYDIMDKPLAIAQGSMNSGGTISVDLVSETFYDSNHTESQGIGNGLVSVSKVYTGEGSESRVTKYWYDYRDRLIGQLNPEAPHQVFGYDRLGRQIEQANWTDGMDFTTGATGTVPSPADYGADRSTYTKSFYNNRGMVYRQIQAIDPTMDPAGGSYPGYLETLTWYDPEGMVAATWRPSGPATKTVYDQLDRPLKSYVTNRKDDGLWGSGSYEEVFDSGGTTVNVSDETVLAQTEYHYIAGGNPGAGQADLVTNRIRLHNTSALGELDGSNSISRFMVSHFDDASRVTDTLNYGTNDTTNNKFVSGTSAPTTIDLNRSTSPALISSVEFDAIGRQQLRIDPRGTRTYTIYDDLSRSIAVIENQQTGFDESNISWDTGTANWMVSWGTSPQADQNRVTTFVYDDNSNVTKRTAHINTGDVQVTGYEYGVTASTGSGAMESRINAPGMLAEVHYPDESTGLPGSSAAYTVSYAYNRLGEPRAKTDQNGIIHAYTRDGLGRVLADEVTFPTSTDIDQAVAKITTSYDDHGRVSGVYSWDDTPSELNSVEYEYTPLHQIKAVVENVDVGGSAFDERVEYDYVSAKPTSTGGNYTRLSAVRYPAQAAGSTNTYEVDYGASGSINDVISRVNGLDVPNWSPPDDELVRYTYLGVGMPIRVNYTSGSIRLDATKAPDGSSTSGEYPAYDRFGRVVWHAWVNNSFTTGTNPGYPNATPLVARRYAYDETTKLRTLDWDGRPGVVLDDRDWEYTYDGLDRLTEGDRGQWDPTTPALTLAANSRQWDLDMLGNWNSVATDLNGASGFEAGAETEDRTYNLANELLSREAEPGSGPGGSTPSDFAPAFDDAGNLVNNGGGGARELAYVYDAWNRLVKVEKPGSFSILENEYNGIGWRIVRRMDTSDSAYDGLDEERRYYFDPSWRMIEEHVDTDLDGDFTEQGVDYAAQQFWGLRYIDDAVAKRIDRDNEGDWEELADQYFYLTDAMFSVRAVTDVGGSVRERVDYTPYGRAMHRYAGDYDGDGLIGLSDISILNAQSGGGTPLKPGDSGYNPHVDLNGNGSVDSTDGSIFSADYAFVSTNANGVPPEGWLSDNARTGSDGTDNQYGFDGYWFDAAGATDAGSFGLYCVRNRFYDVTLGRWLPADPSGVSLHLWHGASYRQVSIQPQIQYADGSNLYQYAQSGSPYLRDPFGLKSCDYCGPDISSWMNIEVILWSQWVDALVPQIVNWASQDAPWYIPDLYYEKGYHYTFLALAGRQMTYFPDTKFYSANCPTENCANTVTLAGTCIHVSEVGNIIYGVAARHFRMTWLQTWAGSLAGNRGNRTTADAAAVRIGWDFGGTNSYFESWLATIGMSRLDNLGSDAPSSCQPCTTSVSSSASHVLLPPITSTMNHGPLVITVPSTVH